MSVTSDTMPGKQATSYHSSNFDLDIVISVLSRTIFSPFFCVFIPLSLLSQVKSTSHPAFIAACIWTGLICAICTLRHIDRVYASGGNWLLAPPKINWGEQVVLITGGGTGIGALLAETLAMRGVTVVVLSKDAPKYEIEHQNIYTYVCDVSNYQQVVGLVEAIRQEAGDPTILVNNAGVVKGKLLIDLEEDDIRDTFGANTLAQFWILKAFLPAMLKEGTGHVVTMASILGLVGTAQMTDYCASKAALVSLHQTLRAELDFRYLTPAIRTTLVMPSFAPTTLFSQIHLPGSKLFSFLAPPVQPHTIVKSIIDALDSQESRIIRLPWYSNVARIMGSGVGIVPKWLGDGLQWIAGSNHAMTSYGPHPDAGERLAAQRKVTKKTGPPSGKIVSDGN